ncbi:unnamed protein product [Camellia sinensis]
MVLTNFNGTGVGFGFGIGCGFGVGWGFGGMPLNFLGLGAVEAVELDSALDGDLGQLLVVSIGHLGSHFKELILTMRVKLMVRSPPIHQETNNVICRCNDSIPVVSMEKEVTVQHLDAWFGKG